MPILGVPLALIGLAALPALTAIYWLRTRFRRQEVSSLFLWSLVAQAHGGGRRATRLQTPLLWLLELLALLLLAFAAAGPRIPRADRVVPVVVVLDDSFSMSAVDDDGRAVRDDGVDAIAQELAGLGPFTARFVVAGPTPALQEDAISRLADLDSAIRDWRCESTSSAIGPAIALAREVGGPDCRVLVISDHRSPDDGQDIEAESDSDTLATPPASGPADQAGRLRWRAVGQPQPNAAIVNAVRSTDPQRDQVLLEIANYSDKPYSVGLTLSAMAELVDSADTPADVLSWPIRVIDRRTLDLAAHETRRLRLAPPKKNETLIADLDDDALPADNRAVLLPPAREPLPVFVSIKDPVLAKAVRSAIQASGVASLDTKQPRLRFTDQVLQTSIAPSAANDSAPAVGSESVTGQPESFTPWRVEFEVPPAEAIDAYLGPFVIDYTHPLAAGLSLTGLVWAAPTADASQPPVGRPVVSAGDVALITERGLSGDARSLRIRLRADRSTLLSSSAWPVLIANIIDWQRAELPGLSRVNARPGMPVRLKPLSPVEFVDVTYQPLTGAAPDEAAKRIDIHDGVAILNADRPGMYQVSAGEHTHRYTVNALSPEESDVRKAATADHGLWNDERALRTDYRGLAWILGLAALGLLALHAWLQYRPAGPSPAVISEATT